MLQIKNISKQFKTGDLVQVALDNVSLNFRDNEFVSILGPSGSGKTTLLNIIGGLDRYDKGDLIINNISTKRYKDRDWDSYRNHTVGFVFQSYNLIPHQSILSNVELALTISGISKKARKRRALEALDQVGLRDQAHKKPNQMSGGQMQRVAIARALVNNPDILLADEPTGALDTVTSVQVMELLKEVAKDRLVVMVTHNPELAEQYSTRIVNLRDGKILGDTNPFEPDYTHVPRAKHKNLGKSSMSLLTAFSLSLNNLLTKKGRTILTSFAGSIGIIGIAMILSLSTGFQNYVDKIQEDTLTSYPLSINAETGDAASLLLSMSSEEEDVKENTVKEQQNIADLFESLGKNDLRSFKKHLEDNQETVDEMVSLTTYSYAVQPTIYTKNKDNELVLLNPSDFMATLMGSSSSLMTGGISIFAELINDDEIANERYEVIAGKMPKEYNEIMLCIPDDNEISDLLLYGLGLRDLSELEDMIGKIVDGEKVVNKNEPLEFTYEELMDLELKFIDASAKYKYNSKYNIYEDMSDDDKFMRDVYNNAIDLKIVGIVKPKGDGSSGMMGSGVLYTRALTEYMIETASKSEIVKKQLANDDVNVFSNKRFDDEEKDAGLDFEDMISIDEDIMADAFGGNLSEDDIKNLTTTYMTEISSAITTDITKPRDAVLTNLKTLTNNLLNGIVESRGMFGMATVKEEEIPGVINDFFAKEETKLILANMEKEYVIPQDVFKELYSQLLTGLMQGMLMPMGGMGGDIPVVPDNTLSNTIVPPGGMGGLSNTVTNEIVVPPTIDDETSKEKVVIITKDMIPTMVDMFVSQEMIITTANTLGAKMTEASMQKTILTSVGELTGKLMESVAGAFTVDGEKMASAFKFELSEEEMRRLFQTMTSTTVENADTNLLTLGYQDLEEPTYISFYFNDFDSKERFIDFIDEYNKKQEKEDEEKVIKYSDVTGMLMSSVKTIVDSVSYVLIAFVSISLVVSSIMIGIITYISVLERTKEIGVLRAIGASKRNISSIFSAETFIVGLLAGLIGIGVTLLLLIPTNIIIHNVNEDITAVLPYVGGMILVVLSVILTLIGGIIPSKAAAKKDPVLALRSE